MTVTTQRERAVEPLSKDTMLDVNDLAKVYPSRTGAENTVFSHLDLQIQRGEFVTVIGPSGCGKTTLLNCVAGLESPTAGTLSIDGVVSTGPGPDRAVVFQAASLLPWLSVARNVAYGMRLRRQWSRAEIKSRVDHVLELVGLSASADHYPHEISGGMQQRANLARALAVEPKLVLMDEPFAALDALTKERLQDELSRVAGTLGATVLFISHDITEAVFLSDRVVVMGRDPGRVTAELVVPFPRPRDRSVMTTPEFKQLVDELRERLHPAERSESQDQEKE